MDGKLEFTKFSETVIRQVQKPLLPRLRSGVLDFGDPEETKTGDSLVLGLWSIMTGEQVSLKKLKRGVETVQAGSWRRRINSLWRENPWQVLLQPAVLRGEWRQWNAMPMTVQLTSVESASCWRLSDHRSQRRGEGIMFLLDHFRLEWNGTKKIVCKWPSVMPENQ